MVADNPKNKIPPRKKKAKKKISKKKIAKKKNGKKKTKANPKGAGRSKAGINWALVRDLCKIQCTGEEIASVLDIDYDTLQRACKEKYEIKFAEYIEQKKKGGKASLRRVQFKKALAGNPTMLIWMGKQYLNQTDKKEISGPDGGPQEHIVIDKIEYEKIRAKMIKDDDV